MEDVIRTKVMSLSLLFDWLIKQASSDSDITSLSKFNLWLEKVQIASRPGTEPPDAQKAQEMRARGLKWKPQTHRWVRPQEEEVREEKKQPRLQEIHDYVEGGGFTEIGEKVEAILQELFPHMLNAESITRLKEVESIQEKESRKKYREMTKEKAVRDGIITADEEWNGMKYNHFTDIIAGRMSFSNANQVIDAVQLLHDKQEEFGFEIMEDENHGMQPDMVVDGVKIPMNDPLDGYYRRYHMLVKMKTDEGKTVTMEVQLGTANQTTIANWAHDLLHKKGASRPILNAKDKRIALKYITQMSELYAYHDGIEGAKNVYPADCVDTVKQFATCLAVPES